MTAEPALKLVESEDVETKALSIVEQASAVAITDSETYTAAGSLWIQLGDMIKEIKDTFDPICDAAHKAHKAATAKRSKFLDPVTAAQKAVKQLMEKYDTAQEIIRKAEEARLAEIARKEEEERLLLEAIAAEEDAKRNGATKEEAAEEAAAIINEPVYVPPVVVPKSVPKMTGGPVYQERWYAEVVSIKDLCMAVATGKASSELVTANMVALNRMAVSCKSGLNVAGVKAYSKRV